MQVYLVVNQQIVIQLSAKELQTSSYLITIVKHVFVLMKHEIEMDTNAIVMDNN